jgi:fucose 4-O-acetylase-like acetyltransferase
VSPASRDPWLDNVKMVLVTVVVIGHSIQLTARTEQSHWAYDFIYLWHIPAFVFISGYLSRTFAWDRRRFKSLVYTLLVPYLIFEAALYYYRLHVVGEGVQPPLWTQPHWTMWYLLALLLWRLATPILKLHWLWVPGSVAVSLAGGYWHTEWLGLPRVIGLLPFFVLGLWLRPEHLKRLDDVWVRLAAVGSLAGIAWLTRHTDEWTRTAYFWYDVGYDEFRVDNELAFQARLLVMVLGLLGTISVIALVPRRSLGWFTSMGTASMVVYLFHGFVIKTAKRYGWPEFTAEHVTLGFWLTIVLAVALAMLLASPPVRRVLEPLTNPLGWLEARRKSRREARGPNSA